MKKKRYEITIECTKRYGKGAGARKCRAWIVEAFSFEDARQRAKAKAARHYEDLRTINGRLAPTV
jgi:hypothetical protein